LFHDDSLQETDKQINKRKKENKKTRTKQKQTQKEENERSRNGCMAKQFKGA
jgi:hypothetical protein